MTKIAAISVPTVNVPASPAATGKAAAPGQVKKEAAAPQPVVTPAPAPVPAAPPVAAPAMSVLIEAQGQSQGKGHTDPQPTHGNDDQHGHKPPIVEPPVTPPAPQPPVVQPPVVEPPVVAPPVRPVVFGDPSAAARTQVMLDRQLADVAISTLARNTFLTAAAERHTAAYVGQAGAAISLLSVLGSDMQAFNAGWSVRELRA